MSFTRRLLIFVPAATRSTFRTWWHSNIDTEGSSTFDQPIQLISDDAETIRAYWAYGALTGEQLFAVVRHIADLASLTVPVDWETLTIAEQKAWVDDNFSSIVNSLGIRIYIEENTRRPINAREILSSLGMQRTPVAP